jgi:hypothetical protein
MRADVIPRVPMKPSTRLVLFATLLLAGSTARAEGEEAAPFANPPPAAFAPAHGGGSFGGATQWVLSMATATGSSTFFLHKVSGGSWELNLQPALDYFITDRVSIGGLVGVDHTSGDAGATTVSVGARAGFNVNVVDRVTFWPTAGLYVSHVSLPHDSNTATRLAIFAPFLFHPAPHIFVGAGPSFQLGLSGGDYKLYGLDVIIGGWI